MSGDCMEMFVSAQGHVRGIWKDTECNSTKSYVCKKRNRRQQKDDLGKAGGNISSLCEEGWDQYDLKCYKLERNSVNWEGASARCYSFGGHLASIHSGKENDFLADVLLKNLVRISWIGLHDRGAEGVYTWDDGSDIDYTKWLPGESSGRSMKQDDCIAMGYPKQNGVTGAWYDAPCTVRKPYICQKEIYMLPYNTVDNTAGRDVPTCEDKWKYFDQYCFTLIKEWVSWLDASKDCASMGGNLASIHSTQQNDFFEVFSMGTGVLNWWIGLYDVIDGIFEWADNTEVDYTNWSAGEPDGNYFYSGDCVAQVFHNDSRHGQWVVVKCSTNIPYICQKKSRTDVFTTEEIFYETTTFTSDEMVDTTSDLLPKEAISYYRARGYARLTGNNLSNCSEGWHLFGNHCYNIVTNLTTWGNASAQCSNAGGYLTSIHSEEENDFITKLVISQSVRNWWIGLHDPNLGKYEWDDGSDVNFSNCRIQDSPGLCFMSGDCMEMFVYAQGHVRGIWKDTECNSTKSYVCKKQSRRQPKDDLGKAGGNISSLCEEGWHQYDLKCYKLERNSINWEGASARCYSIGGHLASIHSGKENDFLADVLLKNLVRISWIGLHDRGVEGVYTWDDGSDIDYTKWLPGEPSGRSMKQDDCIAMGYPKQNGVTGAWYDAPCTVRKPYICQKEISAPRNKSTNVRSVKRICEIDWIYYGEYCYKLVRDPLKWHDALFYCYSMNGNLTSIHSQKQQDFLTTFILRNMESGLWIGLHDSVTEGNYTWVDGFSVEYTNWSPGEPSRYFSNEEDCVEMRYRPRSGFSGQWNDAACSKQKAFICQKHMQKIVNANEEKNKNHGFVSMTTFFLTLLFVVISMIVLVALFQYKRLWIEDKGVKMKTVLFKSSRTDTERLTEIDIKENQDYVDEPVQKYNLLK